MDGNIVRLRKQLLKGHTVTSPFCHGFLGEKGVERYYPHFQSPGAVRHHLTDIAKADDAQRLIEHLHTHEFLFFPLAAFKGGRGLGNMTGKRQKKAYGMFCGGDGIGARRIHHHDTLSARGIRINVIIADARPADNLEPAA
ncbi:MAG: hypothetical protein H6Q45_884 [Deltaproteobacteria bacterium]|nr:hypothetical protein [Deltaproteobacteria bacterium]